MTGSDAEYYRKRAREERERAAICEDNTAALAHLRMADEYDRRADSDASGSPVVATLSIVHD